jgi:hypothetical protein
MGGKRTAFIISGKDRITLAMDSGLPVEEHTSENLDREETIIVIVNIIIIILPSLRR